MVFKYKVLGRLCNSSHPAWLPPRATRGLTRQPAPVTAAAMPRRTGAEFFSLFHSSTDPPFLHYCLEQRGFWINTRDFKIKGLVPAQRREDIFPRQRTRSVTCRMPLNVRAKRDLRNSQVPLSPHPILQIRKLGLREVKRPAQGPYQTSRMVSFLARACRRASAPR